MKSLFSKPISSPNRAEKFPPPLMRFLRSNVGSKSSRARTRASPMFMRKNKNNIAIEKTQEPSSPKVTCIGQVRVRRSSNNTTKKHQQIEEKKTPKTTTCCCKFQCKIIKLHRPKSLISNLKKWVCCFPFGYCVKKVESAQKVQKIVTTNAEIAISESEENENGYADSHINPPKNALILTRCRSAPYRSSSLASKFWGSPLNSQNPQNNIRELEEDEEEEEKPPPVLEKPIIGDLGSRKSHGNEEMQSSVNEESSKACVHPLLLTRCKSDPAKTGERLNPRRFSDTNPLS
ncbi:uncharacterized protein [Solanum tuberosum]|uniref:Uncharacterized protein n=1 Tax=Solanum tuberosum TaxID=4113 RepID=M0ZNC3_SOLTU|nr:PREDICTED: uncharacterized protein LOC102595172 [Solanum tuberosum]